MSKKGLYLLLIVIFLIISATKMSGDKNEKDLIVPNSLDSHLLVEPYINENSLPENNQIKLIDAIDSSIVFNVTSFKDFLIEDYQLSLKFDTIKFLDFFKWLNIESLRPDIRRSFCFVTGYFERYGFNRHAVGATFNFLTTHDGREHWINLSGFAEVLFVNGDYYKDNNYVVSVHWWGGDFLNPSIMLMPVSIFWEENPIDYLHFNLDYFEDSVYIRNIERTFFGNWN